MGFTGTALAAMLARGGMTSAAAEKEKTLAGLPDGKPHFPPKAKNVIWLFMTGGVSQMESFDPKPALAKYADQSIPDTPYKDLFDSDTLRDKVRNMSALSLALPPKILGPQIGFKKYGQSGAEVSDWFPHIGGIVDEIAIVRSMWTTDNNHVAQLQFHTGKHRLDGTEPSIGSWVHYGLGSLNDNLPSFVVMGRQPSDLTGGPDSHSGNYLGPAHNAVPLNIDDPANPLRYASPGPDVFREEQRGQFELLNRLNQISQVEYPGDPVLQARIRSYELAFRMQTAVPEAIGLDRESEATKKLYGLDEKTTRPFGSQCLAARRLVERGVRFVQIYHGGSGAAGGRWDGHTNLPKGHAQGAAEVDKPVAGLIRDLKQRGLLDETLVVFGTEFGRTPGLDGTLGRAHSPFGFSIWMAGGGIKSGVVHGATDELGFNAVESRHYVTDLHATILHQLGLNPKRLDLAGHKRIEQDYGEPIWDIIS